MRRKQRCPTTSLCTWKLLAASLPFVVLGGEVVLAVDAHPDGLPAGIAADVDPEGVAPGVVPGGGLAQKAPKSLLKKDILFSSPGSSIAPPGPAQGPQGPHGERRASRRSRERWAPCTRSPPA